MRHRDYLFPKTSRLQYGRADEFAVAELRQRFVRLGEPKHRGVGPHACLGGYLQEVSAVVPGEIGHRDDLSLTPENTVRKGGNVRHVDARAYNPTTLANGAKRCRHQRADGRVEDGGVKLDGRQIFRCASPTGAEGKRKTLRRLIPLPGECIEVTVLPARNLRNDVSGGAKPIDTDMSAFAGHHQRTPTDQAGTEQRR